MSTLSTSLTNVNLTNSSCHMHVPWHTINRDIRKMKRGITLVPTKSTLYRPTKDARDPGSNWGPSDLQSDAPPTELSRLGYCGRLPGAKGLCVTTTFSSPTIATTWKYCIVYRHAFVAPKHWDGLAEWSKALASGASPKGRGFEPHSRHFKSLESSTQTRPSTAHADMNQTVCQSATHERRLHYGDSTRCHDELMFTLATQLISVHQTNSPCLVKGRPTCCPTASARWVAQVHAKRQRQIQIRIATPESEYISAWPDVKVAPIVSLAQGN